MTPATSVSYTPFGRHVAILELDGPCTGADCCRELVGLAARAVEADRTGLVIDLRRASGLGADLLEAILEIQRAADISGWRVAVVRPAVGPLRQLFRSTDLDIAVTHVSTRATAIVSVMSGLRKGAHLPPDAHAELEPA